MKWTPEEMKARKRILNRRFRANNPNYMREYRAAKGKEAAGRERPDACEVCQTPGRVIHFDHCHKTGFFRGWLCSRCNHALGHAGDSPAILRALAVYLEKWEVINSLI